MTSGSRSTRRTASTARPATSRIPARTSTGWFPKAAAGPITRTCSLLLAGAALSAALPAAAQVDATAYVRARAADARGAAKIAAAGYAEALDKAPHDTLIAMRAYRQALEIGDLALARRAADILEKAGVAPPDTALFDFALALKQDDKSGVDAALKRLRKGPLDFLAPVLDAWVTFDRGGDPIKVLDAANGDMLAARYVATHRALLLIARGKPALGVVALKPSLEASEADLDARIDAAALLAATGEQEAARGLLAGRTRQMTLLRDQLRDGVRPSARFGASRLFLGLAADLAQEDTAPLSVLLTRMAMLLDPVDDRARLYLGEALSRAGSHDMALAVLGEVPPASPFAHSADAGAVAVLSRSGRTAEALARARTLSDGRDATGGDARAYADLLAANGRYADAAKAYDRAIARGAGDDWKLHLARGVALDRAGRWKQAESALRKAVALAPDEPEPLTWLGRAKIERGEDLAGAQALLEHARRLKPDDPEIADSLAWSYFLQGDATRALPLLEKAARAHPDGARVNEHLGDAYWRLGRRYEARYAWRAAAIYADGDAAARIADKLANGPVAAR